MMINKWFTKYDLLCYYISSTLFMGIIYTALCSLISYAYKIIGKCRRPTDLRPHLAIHCDFVLNCPLLFTLFNIQAPFIE